MSKELQNFKVSSLNCHAIHGNTNIFGCIIVAHKYCQEYSKLKNKLRFLKNARDQQECFVNKSIKNKELENIAFQDKTKQNKTHILVNDTEAQRRSVRFLFYSLRRETTSLCNAVLRAQLYIWSRAPGVLQSSYYPTVSSFLFLFSFPPQP